MINDESNAMFDLNLSFFFFSFEFKKKTLKIKYWIYNKQLLTLINDVLDQIYYSRIETNTLV
jgi:hypothetical protein